MNTSEGPLGSAFACRHCQSYIPEGRRGGHCQLLNVAVQGCWRSCALGTLSFTPVAEPLPQPTRWSEAVYPHWVELAAHEVPGPMVVASSAVMGDTLPASVARLRETLADPSAA